MRRGPVRLELDRRGESVELTLHPEPACASHVRIVGQQASARISDGTLFVGRAFALAAPDGMLQQHFALALARHVNGYRPGSVLLARGRQADSLVRFAFGVDAVQSLAGRGPESTPPRWQAPSPAETALAAQMLERAGVYASPSLPDSPASPASPAASGPEGASEPAPHPASSHDEPARRLSQSPAHAGLPRADNHPPLRPPFPAARLAPSAQQCRSPVQPVPCV